MTVELLEMSLPMPLIGVLSLLIMVAMLPSLLAAVGLLRSLLSLAVISFLTTAVLFLLVVAGLSFGTAARIVSFVTWRSDSWLLKAVILCS